MICLSDLPAMFLDIWPRILVMDALRYLIPASLAALVVFAWAPAWLRRRRLQARHPRSADFRREIGFSLLTVLIFSLTGFGIYTGMQVGLFQVYGEIAVHGWGWLLASIALALLAHDTYFYWAHRAMHHPWLYRRIHRLHHRSVTPTPWAAYAFHPTEAVIEAAFLPLFLLFVPMHGLAVTIFLAVMILRNVVGHAGFELHPAGMARSPWFGWLTTTTHHDMHHARPDGNYGLYFTWWDRLMGTEHPDYHDRFDAATGRKPAAGALPAAIAALTIVLLAAAPRPAQAADVLGRWVTPGVKAVVELAACDGGALCGRVVWLWDTVDAAGAPRRDAENADAQLRDRPLQGLALLSGLRSDGTGAWHDGDIYNPEDGQTSAASLRLRAPDVLEVTGCRLVFCRTQIWRRPQSLALALTTILGRAH